MLHISRKLLKCCPTCSMDKLVAQKWPRRLLPETPRNFLGVSPKLLGASTKLLGCPRNFGGRPRNSPKLWDAICCRPHMFERNHVFSVTCQENPHKQWISERNGRNAKSGRNCCEIGKFIEILCGLRIQCILLRESCVCSAWRACGHG